MTTRNQHFRLLLLALIGILPFTLNGLVNSHIAGNALLYWGFELLTWVVIPSAIAWQVMRTPGMSFAELGFHRSIRGQHQPFVLLLVCAAFAPLCYGVYSVTFDYFSSVLTAESFFTYESVVPASGPLYYVVLIYFALSAGLVEEFLYRGLLLRVFTGLRHASLLFVLVSPILFSIVHWEDGHANLASTWVFGVFMAISYLGLRNLWPLVIGHLFTDLLWFS